MQQIEFPFDAEDQGSTLVKRFEALVSLSEKLAQLMGLEGIVSVGERVQILDNINPGGGGEYLDQEGIFGVRGRIPGWSGDVLILMLAGVDTSDLEDLGKMVYEQGAGGLGASQESRILLFNTNLDRVTNNKGLHIPPKHQPLVLETFAAEGQVRHGRSYQPIWCLAVGPQLFLSVECRDP